MSIQAWKILSLFIKHTETRFNGDYGRGYLACWHITEKLGVDVSLLNSIGVKRPHADNKLEQAMHELVQLGLIEEVPDLGERYRLVVKD